MPIILSCPRCQARLRVAADVGERSLECGACGFRFAPLTDEPPPVLDTLPVVAPAAEKPARPPDTRLRTAEAPASAVPVVEPLPPVRRVGCLLYGLALAPLGVAALGVPFCRFGTGVLGGLAWGALAALLTLACLFVVRRTGWHGAVRAVLALLLAGGGYLVLFVALGVSGWQWLNSIDPSAWQDFAPPGGRFHVSMPGTPVPQPPQPGVQGSYVLELRWPDVAFGVSFGDVPLAEWNQMPIQARFDNALAGMQANLPGSWVVSQKRIALDGNPGREYHLQVPGRGEVVARVYFVRNRFIILLVAGSRIGPQSPEVATFFDSFRPDPLDPKLFPPLRPDEQPPDIEDEDIRPGRTILGREQKQAQQLVIARDGGTLAVAGADGTVRLWGLPGGEDRGTLNVPLHVVPNLRRLLIALSPDGRTLAAGTVAGALKLYDTATQNELATLAAGGPDEAGVAALAFSPDGKYLASAYVATPRSPPEVRLWDVAGRKVARTVRGKAQPTALAFAPDGRFLVVGDVDGALRWVDPAAGGEVRRFQRKGQGPLDPTQVTALAFTADGAALVSAHHDHSVRLWDVRTGQDRVVLQRPGGVVALDVSPNGKFLATGTFNGELRVSETAGGKMRWEEPGLGLNQQAPATCLAFTPDGRRLALVRQQRVELWELEKMIRATADELAPPQPPPAGEPAVPGGTPARLEAHVAEAPGGGQGVFGLALSADGKTLITVGRDRNLRYWELSSGRKRAEAVVGLDLVGLSAGADTVAVALPNTVYLHDAATAQMRDTRTPDAAAVVEAMMRPDLREILKRSHGGKLPPPEPGTVTIGAIAFAPDGKTLAVVYPGAVHQVQAGAVELWDVPAGKVRLRFATEAGANRIAFAPDGATLALGRDNDPRVCLYDVPTGKLMTRLKGVDWGVGALAWSGDGRYVAATSGQKILIWDAQTGEEKRRLEGHPQPVTALAFSPDGRSLACGERDGAVHVYDVRAGRAVGWFTSTGSPCLLFSRDGKSLIAGGSDGGVDLWRVDGLPRPPAPPEPVADKRPAARPAASGKDLQPAGKIEPFLAVAVDPKSGRALSLGRDRFLRVYSYPDFRPQRAYWLGVAAYRAALDAEHGLLYAAGCDAPRLQMERAGRVDGSADLYVYDVKKVLAGEELPGHVLRPVAVVGRMAKILHLVCTPDGRWVYFLESDEQGRYLLGRLDGRTHKPDEARAVENGTGGLCLSRDGQTLYVGRVRQDPAKAPQHWGGQVLRYDTATMKPRDPIDVPCKPQEIAEEGELLFAGGDGALAVVDLRRAAPAVAASWDGPWLAGSLRTGAAPRRLYLAAPSSYKVKVFVFPERIPAERPEADDAVGEGDLAFLGDWQPTPDGKYLLCRTGVVLRLAVPGMNRPLPPAEEPKPQAGPNPKGLPLRERDPFALPDRRRATALAAAPDGKGFVVGGDDGWVFVCERDGGRANGRWYDRGGVAFLAYRPGGKEFVSTTFDRQAQLRLANNPEAVHYFQGLSGYGRDAVAFTAGGAELAAAGGDGKAVLFWWPSNGRVRRTVRGFPDPLTAVALSPGDKWLAAGSTAGPVRLVDLNNPRTTRTLAGHEAEVRCLAYAPDGKTLASAGVDGTVRLWDPDAGKPRHVLRGHTHVVLCLAYSPDSKLLVSGGADGSVRVWDAATGAERGVLPPRRPGAMVYALAFTPDGKALAAACGDEVRQWDVGE